jgi:2,3-bisphosphoglycerate-independent phosphoglycerate mutase
VADSPKVRKRPVVLIVRDGWGENPDPSQDYCNAVVKAAPAVDAKLSAEYPTTLIHTSGEWVGLPNGIMGNSEVGHQNLGAGRVVEQELLRINRAVESGALFKNPTLLKAIEQVKTSGKRLHFIGLLSDAGVHSHLAHLLALIELAKDKGLAADQVMIHAILDGRDTGQYDSPLFIAEVEATIKKTGVGRISTVIGRYYAMDRDNRWDRVQLAYDLLTLGKGSTAADPLAAVKAYYDAPSEASRQGDEYVLPTVICSGTPDPKQLIGDGDGVVFFNYRTDRPRELTKAFVFDDDAFSKVIGGGFKRTVRPKNLAYTTMTTYEDGLPVEVIFPRGGDDAPPMGNILGAYLSSQGLAQFRCAESEKHPHVTFFFDDMNPCFNKELQIDIPSPKHVSTYDKLPVMSAVGVTKATEAAIKSGLFDFILVNFANCDMVGHTGNLEAATASVKAVDEGVGRLVDATLKADGALVITADHGNCEQMINPKNNLPHTQHTLYDVKLIAVDPERKNAKLRAGGALCDVAPTCLDLLGVPKPKEMTGRSLYEA